jgi:hypothetical protein
MRGGVVVDRGLDELTPPASGRCRYIAALPPGWPGVGTPGVPGRGPDRLVLYCPAVPQSEHAPLYGRVWQAWWPNVTVQVIPEEGAHPGLLGAFALMELPGMPAIVDLERRMRDRPWRTPTWAPGCPYDLTGGEARTAPVGKSYPEMSSTDC